MVTPNSIGHTSPDEVLAHWEGPAVHEPGVLLAEQQAEQLAAGNDVAELVAWLAVTALSGVIGNAAYASLQAKVLGVLSAWRQRFGQARINEVKQRLIQHVQQDRNHCKLTGEELRARIEFLFDEVQGKQRSEEMT